MPLEEASKRAALVEEVAALLMDVYEDIVEDSVKPSDLNIFAEMASAVVDRYLEE